MFYRGNSALLKSKPVYLNNVILRHYDTVGEKEVYQRANPPGHDDKAFMADPLEIKGGPRIYADFSDFKTRVLRCSHFFPNVHHFDYDGQQRFFQLKQVNTTHFKCDRRSIDALTLDGSHSMDIPAQLTYHGSHLR